MVERRAMGEMNRFVNSLRECLGLGPLYGNPDDKEQPAWWSTWGQTSRGGLDASGRAVDAATPRRGSPW